MTQNRRQPLVTQRQLIFALAGFLTAAIGYGYGAYYGYQLAQARQKPCVQDMQDIPLSIAKPRTMKENL